MQTMKNDTTLLKKRIVLMLFVLVVFFMLMAGLKPRGYRIFNRTAFLSDGTGVQFVEPSIAFSRIPRSDGSLCGADTSFTLLMNFSPSRCHTYYESQIIAFCDDSDDERIIVSQYDQCIVIRGNAKGVNTAFFCDSVLQCGKQNSVAVVSGCGGIDIFVDGNLKQSYSRRIAAPQYVVFPKRIIIGNSADGRFAWSGSIKNIRVYGRKLSGEEIVHGEKSAVSGYSGTLNRGRCLVIDYDFTAAHHRVVGNRAGAYADLYIPRLFTMLKKHILSPPGTGWKFDKSAKLDYIVNFIGFFPFGFLLAGIISFQGVRRRKNVTLCAVIGALFSLFIELTQVFIPTRNSELSDLVLNTLGTFCGSLSLLLWERKRWNLKNRTS
jgi:hypothetical protein